MKITVEASSLDELKTLLTEILGHTKPDPDMPISELDLSTRTLNCLAHANIGTISQLRATTENQLIKLPNLGKSSLIEIRLALSAIFGTQKGTT